MLKTRSGVKVKVIVTWENGTRTLCHPKMYSNTKFGNSYRKEYWGYAPDSMPILETRSEVKVAVALGRVRDTYASRKCVHIPNLGFLPTIIYRDMLQTPFFLRTRSEVQVQDHTRPESSTPTLRYPKMHPHTKFWDSCLKEYRRYAPDRKQDGRADGLFASLSSIAGHKKLHVHVFQ